MPDQQPNPAEIPDVIKIPNVVSQGARWLFGQEANTVALFAIVGLIAFAFARGVPYFVSVGREMHKEATDSIEHIIENQHEALKQVETQHREDRKQQWERVAKVNDVLEKQTQSIDKACRSVEALVVELKEERRRELKPAKGNP